MTRWVLSGVLSVLLLFCMAGPVAADTVRVIAVQAAIRLNADPNSMTVAMLPAGTVLEVNGRQGAWYSVWLPADREGGARRLGFIAASDAELMEDDTSPQPAAVPVAAPPEQLQSLPPPRRRSADFDGFGGVTFKLPGARAIVVSTGEIADSGEHNILPTFGFSIGKWFGGRQVSGVFFGFSGVSGGTAFAQIGASNRSEASFTAFDVHGGWQVQYPGRVRPYVFGGLGLYSQKSTASITLQGLPASTIDQTDNLLSFLFGGGVRFMITDSVGARAGLDALSVRVTEGGYINYGRIVGGTFVSF